MRGLCAEVGCLTSGSRSSTLANCPDDTGRVVTTTKSGQWYREDFFVVALLLELCRLIDYVLPVFIWTDVVAIDVGTQVWKNEKTYGRYGEKKCKTSSNAQSIIRY